MSNDANFRFEIERLFGLGVPLAQIKKTPRGVGTWVEHDYLMIRCPDGRSPAEILTLAKDASHTALVVETKYKGGEFLIGGGGVMEVELSERLPVEDPVGIRGNMAEITASLANIR
ncbi:hypothetical protein MOV66_00565 [Agrobacterium sp. SHOUNA12C]|nr:hypothetical protein [Agrobacterium sp. BETTINA12B]MCJ9755127.1 hypothetical protein [Agrobacterium sp. SHOUNA12C]